VEAVDEFKAEGQADRDEKEKTGSQRDGVAEKTHVPMPY
jgi:hypothetical protein